MSKGSSITLWKELDELAHKAATKFGIRKTFELRPVTHPRARHFGQCSRGGVIMLRVPQPMHPEPNHPVSRALPEVPRPRVRDRAQLERLADAELGGCLVG